MATLTRQQLIDVIDQYIYANGQQRITAPQLHEILLEIANAFEMVGGGTASGIDEVLEEGSTVSDGREITNGFGGKVQLAVAALDVSTFGSDSEPVEPYEYVGMNVAGSSKIGQVYVDKRKTVIGNLRTEDVAKTFFDLPFPVPADDFYLGTMYNLEDDPHIDGRLHLKAGAHTIAISHSLGALHTVNDGNIFMRVESFTEENTSSNSSVDANQIQSSVVNGPQSSLHIQAAAGYIWKKDNEDIAIINERGFLLSAGKKVVLSQGGSAPTAGTVTLSAGTATINTAAVGSSSIINLTVQEGGLFTGNIRISAKTPGVSFVISSTAITDTCSVFWQIIDI